MEKGNVFQVIIIIVFVVLAVAGVIFFSLLKPSGSDPAKVVGNVVIWGTVPSTIMLPVLAEVNNILPRGYQGKISYKEKDPETFDADLVDALAAGTGPDLFLLSQDDIIKQRNKVYIIPYASYPERRFKDTYIEGAEVYMSPDGVIALPFSVDPLVMYWNRDILSREGIPVVPKNWVDFITLSPQLTKRDERANILQSTVALGEYQNVHNATPIISTLILQADNPIVAYDSTGKLEVVLHNQPGSEQAPSGTESALRFYTEFSNPIKAAYSWNRALPDSRQAFLAGDLAFYFGFASELPELRRANPNLNFDVALMPQVKDAAKKITFGNMLGIAITASTKNLSGSVRVAGILSSNQILEKLNTLTGLPPVSRSLLASPPSDAVQPIFYESAIVAHTWLEPDSTGADTAFKNMIESISSGRSRLSDAVQDAHRELENLLKK